MALSGYLLHLTATYCTSWLPTAPDGYLLHPCSYLPPTAACHLLRAAACYLLEKHVEWLRAKSVADADCNTDFHRLVQQDEYPVVVDGGGGRVEDKLEESVQDSKVHQKDKHTIPERCAAVRGR